MPFFATSIGSRKEAITRLITGIVRVDVRHLECEQYRIRGRANVQRERMVHVQGMFMVAGTMPMAYDCGSRASWFSFRLLKQQDGPTNLRDDAAILD